MSNGEVLQSVIAAAGGDVTGRVRLQKYIYLLDAAGMNSGLFYFYHHYGPYSEDVSLEISKAKRSAECRIREDLSSTWEGNRFSIFTLEDPSFKPKNVGDMTWDVATKILTRLKGESSIIIELAATIHWLRKKEKAPDWKVELKRRKGAKVDDGRMEKAEALLKELELF